MKTPFVTKAQIEEIVKTYPTPFHIYDEKGIRENARKLKQAFAWNKGYKEYFAVKATPNPTILKILKEEGCGTDCSSYTELLMSEKMGITGSDIMFSSNDTPAEEFVLAKKPGAKKFGLHSFLASNTVTNDYYPTLAKILFEVAVELKEKTGIELSYINLSGGVGIPYTPDKEGNDILKIGEGVHKVFDEVLVPAGLGDISLFTELGRFMLAPYGHLVTKAIHEKHIYKEYIGVDACAVNLMRPAMYGAYHHITVLGKENAPCDHTYDVTGSLCENNDKFAIDRKLPKIDMGDYLVIHDTGAHGFAMGYNYNGKLKSAELLLCEDGSVKQIRRAETPEDYFATLDGFWDVEV